MTCPARDLAEELLRDFIRNGIMPGTTLGMLIEECKTIDRCEDYERCLKRLHDVANKAMIELHRRRPRG